MHFQTQSDYNFCCQIENEKTVIFYFVIFWILLYLAVSFLPNIITLIHYYFKRITPSLIYIYWAYLIIHFADGLSVMYIIFSSNGFATHLTLAAFRMIMFLRQFYRITFDFLFADATLILKFLHSIKYEIDKSFRLIHDTIKLNSVFNVLDNWAYLPQSPWHNTACPRAQKTFLIFFVCKHNIWSNLCDKICQMRSCPHRL